MDTAVVNTAAPSIQAGLHAAGGTLPLVVSGYALSYAVLLVTGARLGHLRGHRRLYLVGLGTFTLLSAVCGIGPSAPVLVAARVVQGADVACMAP
jgi:MFS family permease